ncbi:hypothetical protein RUND412_002854, partial [Rhizina undulata]
DIVKDEDHGNTIFYCGTRGTFRALDKSEDMKVKHEDPETRESRGLSHFPSNYYPVSFIVKFSISAIKI